MDQQNKTGALIGNTLLLVCLYWLWQVVIVPYNSDTPPWIFLDYINLIFHEAGHFIFMPLGNFMHVLGGSLMQLLIPGIILGSFIYQKQRFAAGFALFWLGESLSNLSYYIADARTQALPLLGGDTSGHDWTWLLTQTNLLNSDTTIGSMAHFLAVLLMVGSLAWMVYEMYREYTEGQ